MSQTVGWLGLLCGTLAIGFKGRTRTWWCIFMKLVVWLLASEQK